MTDKEAMHIRFSHKNIKKSTGEIAKRLGIDRVTFEQAVKRGMDEDSKVGMKATERRY